MAQRRREFVDSRLRRCPPDRASAVPYGQAGENALRFPHLAHRSAAVHKLHSATSATRIDSDSGKDATFSRQQALAYSSRILSRSPRPPQIFTILSAVAEAERDRTRERVADVKRDQRTRGRYLGGTPPFGWQVGEDGVLMPVPEQQEALARMRALRDAGKPLRAI